MRHKNYFPVLLFVSCLILSCAGAAFSKDPARTSTPAGAPPNAFAHDQKKDGALEISSPEDFFFEVQFSKTEFYAGEPVLLTVTWRQAREVESVAFDVSFLKNTDFVVLDQENERNPAANYLRVPVGAESALAEEGLWKANGKAYRTLTFKRELVARVPGVIELPEASVTYRVLSGYSRTAGAPKPSDPTFQEGLFTPGSKNIESFRIGSKPVKLTVKQLPEEGRPLNFNGAVGRFRISASTPSQKIAMGSPITLELVVKGVGRVAGVPPPVLSQDPELTNAFRVPPEMAPGAGNGNSRVFVQTLWPKRKGAGVIPAITYAYFDPEEGRYQIARSEPIPIEVTPGRVNMEDLSYRRPLREEEVAQSDMAPNYEGPDVISKRYTQYDLIRSPAWVCSVALPPIFFLIFFILHRLHQRRSADPEAVRSRRAYGVFLGRIGRKSFVKGADAGFGALFHLVRNFLGDKLSVKTENLTSADFEHLLHIKGVDAGLIEQLGAIFAGCEQYMFGGGKKPDMSFHELADEAVKVLAGIDRRIG